MPLRRLPTLTGGPGGCEMRFELDDGCPERLELDTARAQEWALLAMLLARAPDAELMGRLARLRGDSSPLGVAHAALGEAAARVGLERAGREYFDLFVGVGRGELAHRPLAAAQALEDAAPRGVGQRGEHRVELGRRVLNHQV